MKTAKVIYGLNEPDILAEIGNYKTISIEADNGDVYRISINDIGNLCVNFNCNKCKRMVVFPVASNVIEINAERQ